ncbi:thiamine pyrophosphate-binding protein, partial [Vibrio anguillarum]|nr:thiamine pyrophosphate-binding protein [Vibrio anguillarum]
SITKYSIQVKTVEQLLIEIQKAISIARSGRPGPVLIDIPMDLQRKELDITFDDIARLVVPSAEEEMNSGFFSVDNALKEAEKPLFIIGGGACAEVQFSAWQKKISALGIPHVSSLKG